jgi:UDP-N-acetylmuramate dehydrogenase
MLVKPDGSIIGTVGGGVYMNAGAYGGEMSSVLKEIEVYDTKSKSFYNISASECDFSYRHSLFMERKELVVTGALFCLENGDESEIDAVCRANMQARKDKQPLEYPSCGSAFKRPEGYFAGKLIEDCGLKGRQVGGAQVSTKHAGFVVNVGGAKATDVLELVGIIKEEVREKFGVELEPEIKFLG